MELSAEAEGGRKWKTALDVLGGFCDERRAEIVRTLETRAYRENELPFIAASLEAIEDFRKRGGYAVELGRMAEKELREDAE